MGCGDVSVVWLNERYGPFEAMVWAADFIFVLQVSPKDSNKDIRAQEFQQMARAVAKALLG